MSSDIEALLDQTPIRGVQRVALAMVTAAIILEGFDIQLIAFVAPVLIAEWGIAKSDMSYVVGAALVGMAVGSVFGGRLGDRWGRRPLLIATVSLFGMATLLAAFAQNIWQIAALRALAGIAFGAAIPNAATLIAEWMPPRLRGQAVGIVIIGVPLGGLLGASICSWLIPALGWRAAFVLGGALPLSVALLMLAALPESLRFLIERQSQSPAIARLIRRLGGNAETSMALQPSSVQSPDIHDRAALFDGRYRRTNPGLWIAFFANLCAAYAFFGWTPTLLSDLGLPPGTAIGGLIYFNLFGILSAVMCAWAVNSIGSRAVMLGAATLGMSATVGLAFGLNGVHTITELWPIMLGLSLAGAAVIGFQTVLYVLAANAYETSCRASGVGMAAAFGRLGGITSSFGGGYILSLESTTGAFLFSVSMLFVMSGIGTVIVDRQIPRKDANTPSASAEKRAARSSA